MFVVKLAPLANLMSRPVINIALELEKPIKENSIYSE